MPDGTPARLAHRMTSEAPAAVRPPAVLDDQVTWNVALPGAKLLSPLAVIVWSPGFADLGTTTVATMVPEAELVTVAKTLLLSQVTCTCSPA